MRPMRHEQLMVRDQEIPDHQCPARPAPEGQATFASRSTTTVTFVTKAAIASTANEHGREGDSNDGDGDSRVQGISMRVWPSRS